MSTATTINKTILARSRFRKAAMRSKPAFRYSQNSMTYFQTFVETRAVKISRAAAIICSSSSRRTIKSADILGAFSIATGAPFDVDCIKVDAFPAPVKIKNKESPTNTKKKKNKPTQAAPVDEEETGMNFSNARLRKLVSKASDEFRIAAGATRALDYVLACYVEGMIPVFTSVLESNKRKILTADFAEEAFKLFENAHIEIPSPPANESVQNPVAVPEAAQCGSSEPEEAAPPTKKRKRSKKKKKKSTESQ